MMSTLQNLTRKFKRCLKHSKLIGDRYPYYSYYVILHKA